MLFLLLRSPPSLFSPPFLLSYMSVFLIDPFSLPPLRSSFSSRSAPLLFARAPALDLRRVAQVSVSFVAPDNYFPP